MSRATSGLEMAKETAHQFGTPISSLMGWLEMLRLSYRDPDKVIDITEEIAMM